MPATAKIVTLSVHLVIAYIYMYMYSAYSILMVACPSPPVDLIPPGDTVVNFADVEDQLNDNELAVAHEHLCTCTCTFTM